MLENFIPKEKFDKVEEISIQYLKTHNVAGIMLDMDSTLVDNQYRYRITLKKWVQDVKKENISVCILTNSFKESKTKLIAEQLGLDYFCYALKPLPLGFMRAMKFINENKNNVIMVGDQLTTDILGANLYGVKSILVNPVEKKENMFMRIKRSIESKILEKYEGDEE